MAIASSGAIELSRGIGGELGGSAGAETGLEDAATGGIATINTASSSYPNAAAPHLMSEWYSYDHSAAPAGYGGIFIDDFHTTGGDEPMDARITYATTGLQDGQSFPTDGDGNTVTTRPIWTYNQSGNGCSHYNNDTLRLTNANSSPNWRTTNVPSHLNFSGTMNIEARLKISSSSNKDMVIFIDTISQGDAWSGSVLDEGYFIQFDDSSSEWAMIRRRNSLGSGTTTLGQSANGVTTKGSWFTAKWTWNQSTGAHKLYTDGNLILSVTDTTYDDFCPSGAGIRIATFRYMSNNAYNECDWIKVWKS